MSLSPASWNRWPCEAPTMDSGLHRPVLYDDVLQALAVRGDGCYVDATFGRGGHAAGILERLGPNARLWLLDRDPAAVAAARERFGADSRCHIVQASFGELPELARAAGLAGAVDGLLLDLGVSSPQLDDAERGFSFLRDGPLDMRMDPASGPSAAEWLARAPESEIRRVLRVYGEEPQAGRIARAVAEARRQGRAPQRTAELARLIEAAGVRREPGRHPATRAFQGIRIHINGELDALERLLAGLPALLAPGGRIAVISFHSLEDRRVKRALRDRSRVGDLPPGVPLPPPERRPTLRLVGGARHPGEAERAANPRARSAVLRVAERLA